MVFKLIDYSQHDPVLIKKAGGKFVQIRNGNTEYFLLSSFKRSKYHANIIDLFCKQELNIDVEFNATQDKCRIIKDGWKIIGGGFWEASQKTITLYGKSLAYGHFDPYNKLSENVKNASQYETVLIQ